MKIKKWITYYRNSLIDGGMLDIKASECKDAFHHPYSELSDKKLKDLYKQITHSKNNAKLLINDDTDEDENMPIDIFISPLHLKTKTHRGNQGNNSIYPFWIPAKLDKNGQLHSPLEENQIPWFLRSVLDPISTHSNSPIISSIDIIDNILDNYRFTNNNWDEYWKSAEQFFKKATGYSYQNFNIEGFIIDHNICIIKAKDLVFAKNNLMFYNDLINNYQESSLISNLLSEKTNQQLDLPKNENLFLSSGHYGQYNNQFPLSNSQRQSLLIFEQEDNGRILAVNGPPGTGKTTLLQSIVANKVVKAVLNGTEPPRIIASSTNNQAITNILDSFASTNDNFNRWIPNLNSIGSYLISNNPNQQKTAQKKGYQTLSLKAEWEGYYIDNFHETSIDQIEEYYIQAFNNSNHSNNKYSVEEISDILKTTIKQLTRYIDIILNNTKELQQFEIDYFPISALPEFKVKIEEQQNRLLFHEREREQLLQFRNRYNHFLDKNKFLIFFSFIPFFKQRYLQKLSLMLADSPSKDLQNLKSNKLVEINLLKLLNTNQSLIESIKQDINIKQQLFNKINTIKIEFDSNHQILNELWEEYLSKKPIEVKNTILEESNTLGYNEWVNRVMDVSLRHMAFENAMHYWEGQWIILQKTDKLILNKGERSRIQFFNHMSYLTPLFVSTFHSLPRFCKAKNQWKELPIYNLFDLLIVDEAGQVSPEIAIPAFSLAKKALVVGDIYQIEPVWNISYEQVDYGNLKEVELLDDYNFEDLKKTGLLCSSGNLMHLARKASRYQYEKENGGTLLTEHRRCVDELVAFSNQYIYNNKLEPMVGSLEAIRFGKDKNELLLPPLSYMNIKGTSLKKNGSLYNELEAEVIAKWLKKYGSQILTFYNEGKTNDKASKLKDIIAIITPFAEQKKQIYKQFSVYGIDKDITVGTVHSLQGAERSIVIFSPTYDLTYLGKSLFFDRKFNMLNVALTRAKHHFIVMGSISLFNPNNNNFPSGALATYLFNNNINELSSSFLFENNAIDSKFRIDTLEKHQQILKKAFEVVKERIVIVSPFISINAINEDDLLNKIKKATGKGVDVLIYTDKYLDSFNGKLKNSSKEGRRALIDAGAKLTVLNGIHNKSLAIDRDILIEGSFNWLSAIRDKKHPYFRYEVSQIIQGEEAKTQIEQLINALESISEKVIPVIKN